MNFFKIKTLQSIDKIDYSENEVAYILLLCSGGDTFNALLWLNYKRPTIKWKIIAWRRQKEIVDLFISISSDNIFKGSSSVLELIYIEDVMDEVAVTRYLCLHHPLHRWYRGLRPFIDCPGFYWGWNNPCAYPYIFGDSNNDFALENFAQSCQLNALGSSISLPKRVLIAIYPESNHHPQNICNIFDFWDPIIQAIYGFCANLHDNSNIIIRINSNTNSYGYPGGGSHLNRLHAKWSFLASDLRPSVLYSFSQMNQNIITLGFRSGLHDWARVLPLAYHIMLRHYDLDSKIDSYTSDFGLNSIGCKGLFETIFMNNSELLDSKGLSKLICSLIFGAIDRPYYFQSLNTCSNNLNQSMNKITHK
ncbi:hypothetical protein SynPROS71_00099 [Synechococcus sp. PROS-7-1]|nr:hypothetical protein SynPROS71_00099 [Synechococcus sp. PROS-7-1]